MEQKLEKSTFFTKDKTFYSTLFKMLIVVALQNLVAYSVNMVDNVMLGRYAQDALSGAATVNQVFFMVEQFALAIGNSLVVLASQYWGEKRVYCPEAWHYLQRDHFTYMYVYAGSAAAYFYQFAGDH